MIGRLPPLNACRAFEAAARHRSFSGAGRELNITPGAVSHQIRILEGCQSRRSGDKRIIVLDCRAHVGDGGSAKLLGGIGIAAPQCGENGSMVPQCVLSAIGDQ